MSYQSYTFTDFQNTVVHALHGSPNAKASAAQTVNRALALLVKMRPWRWRMKTLSLNVAAHAIEMSISRTSNVVTVQQVAHGFVTGSSVAVVGAATSFNGQFVVSGVINASTFYYNQLGNDENALATIPYTYTCLGTVSGVSADVDPGVVNLRLNTSDPALATRLYLSETSKSAAITSLSRNTNVVTLGLTAHGLVKGAAFTVAGADATFNGNFIVANVVDADTLTYAQTAANGNATAPGTLTVSLATTVGTWVLGGILKLVKVSDPTVYHIYRVSSALVDAGAYDKLSLTHLDGTGLLAVAVPIESLVRDTNVVTLVLTAHGLSAGSIFTVAGADASFNGTFTVVNVVDDNTITYAQTAANETATVTGNLVAGTQVSIQYYPADLTLGSTIPGAVRLPDDFDAMVTLKCAINSFREAYPTTMDDLWLRRQYAYGAAYETYWALNWSAQITPTDVPKPIIEVHPIPQSAGTGVFVGTYMRMVPLLSTSVGTPAKPEDHSLDVPDIPIQYHGLLLVLCRALAVSTEEDRVGSDWELFGRMVQDLAADEGASQGPIVGVMRNVLNRGWRPSPFFPAGRIQA